VKTTGKGDGGGGSNVLIHSFRSQSARLSSATPSVAAATAAADDDEQLFPAQHAKAVPPLPGEQQPGPSAAAEPLNRFVSWAGVDDEHV